MHVLMFSGLTWTNHILFRYSFLQVKGEDCILKKKVTFLNILVSCKD